MAALTVSIADLRTRITFQSPTIAKDAGGAQSETWSNISTNPTVWAKWVYDHENDSQNGAVISIERATVTVRYRSDISSAWGVTSGGAFWKIISPPENVQNLNRWVVFRVERVKGTV